MLPKLTQLPDYYVHHPGMCRVRIPCFRFFEFVEKIE